MEEKSDRKKKSRYLILLLLLIIIGLCVYILLSRGKKEEEPSSAPLSVDETQGEYVEPETPIDRSKNVTLPGWGGFTIPADTKKITQGFEFHNPEENLWYEDEVSIDGKELESLVVDSGNQTELNHYLSLAGIDGNVTEVGDYEEDYFKVNQNEEGNYQIEAVGYFDGTKSITVTSDQGKETEISFTCKQDYYYMTFALYLTEDDELLYQSDLVLPGNYIQSMEMTRALKAGTYDAYVVCQPYRSDGETKTNQGVVNISLTAK